jgi:hypothetical protein
MPKGVNAGRFRVGTIFVGNVNGVYMEVVDIFKKQCCNYPSVLVKNIHTGAITRSNIPTLERLNATIIMF